jgi:3-oxoacyl-[acyl-carrier-protein] synthase II
LLGHLKKKIHKRKNSIIPGEMGMQKTKFVEMRRVVVTGLGLITPLGNDVPTVWGRLLAGESGIARVTHYGQDEKEFRERYRAPEDFPLIAGEIKDFNFKEMLAARKKTLSKEDNKLIKYTDTFSQYALAASLEAVNSSGLNLEEEDPDRVGIIIASGMGGVGSWEQQHINLLTHGVKKVSPFTVPKLLPNLAAGNVSISFQARGPNSALATACAAGAHAIGAAFRSIQLGEAELMATGGAEAAITLLTISGFYRMGALATGFNDRPTEGSRPFDRDRTGFVMSEGAGILILEELEHARRRNASIFAEIVGFSMTGDARHITDPDLGGAVRCMTMAIKDADIQPEQIDYVNPHATSTPTGDRNEARALLKIFNSGRSLPMVSATKSMTGHLMGASGAVEAIFVCLSLLRGSIPPTINVKNVDPDCAGLKLVREVALDLPLRYALSNSFGFGGTNAALIFKRYEE